MLSLECSLFSRLDFFPAVALRSPNCTQKVKVTGEDIGKCRISALLGTSSGDQGHHEENRVVATTGIEN